MLFFETKKELETRQHPIHVSTTTQLAEKKIQMPEDLENMEHIESI